MRAVVFALCMLILGCDVQENETDLVWAVNVGGPAYEGVDGTKYVAEGSIVGGIVARMPVVKGSQDPALYETYREGDIEIAQPIANGTYDITFHFAEPEQFGAGERVFSAYAEGVQIVDSIDVMLWRDGKVRSALTVTVPGIVVGDGMLDIRFEARKREPILSALVVRQRAGRDRKGELVWSDEFYGAGPPDPSHWNIEEWTSGVVNDEDQVYTARPKNVRVDDGHLVIEAHKEEYSGGEYTSARLQSSGKIDILYGHIDVRARLPRGQGTWPAIWMLSSNPFHYATTCEDEDDWQGNDDCDAWPNSGEIDIMEQVGYQMGHVHGTVHSKSYPWPLWNQRKGRILIDDVADQFHVYSLEWTPDRIDILVDDTVYLTYINEGNGWQEWPFDQPFHLIMNFAVGGAWGRAGGPIDESIFPQQMLVDYVRVYQPQE
jgi:beta-glucanase (GH16 family)